MTDENPVPAADVVQEPAAAAEPPAREEDPRAGNTPPSQRTDRIDAEWPEDWRVRLANGDRRLEQRLERFASPRNVVDSMLAAERRLRGGADEAADGNTDGPADVEATAAPDAPEDYQVELPDGMVVGEADAPLVEDFLETAHASNMSGEQVNEALAWYYRRQDEITAERALADSEAQGRAIDELRAAWGGEFRANVNKVEALLDGAPEGLKDNLLGARLADGTLFGDNASALKWLGDVARSYAGDGTLAPAVVGGPGKAMNDEIAAIEHRMAHDRAAYFKDEAAQARYRDLVAARDGR